MVTEVADAKKVDRNCEGCGTSFKLEVPTELSTRWSHFLISTRRYCDPCAEAEDRRRAAEEADENAAMAEAHFRARQKESGMPDMFLEASFDNLDRDDREAAIDGAHRWASGQMNGLLLSGTVGVGKSRIAATAANEMLRRRKVDWISLPSLMVQAKAKLGGSDRDDMTRTLLGKRALVLDDIDKTKATEFALDIILQAVEFRTGNLLPLLVTTNLNSTELKAQMGEAIYSRLIGYGESYRVDGRDRRKDSLSK